MSNTHFLKSWPENFRPLKIGLRQFEVRLNDRSYNVGDRLLLQEWDPAKEQYTGAELLLKVRYILQGKFGLPPDICVMQLELLDGGK